MTPQSDSHRRPPQSWQGRGQASLLDAPANPETRDAVQPPQIATTSDTAASRGIDRDPAALTPSPAIRLDTHWASRGLLGAQLMLLRFLLGMLVLEHWLVDFAHVPLIHRMPLALVTLAMVMLAAVDIAACWQVSWPQGDEPHALETRISRRRLAQFTRGAAIAAPLLLVTTAILPHDALLSTLLLVPLAAFRWLAAARLLQHGAGFLIPSPIRRSLCVPILLAIVWILAVAGHKLAPFILAHQHWTYTTELRIWQGIERITLFGWLTFSIGMAWWFAGYALALRRAGVSTIGATDEDAW